MQVIRSLRVRLLLLVAIVAVPAVALTLRAGVERRNAAAAHVREQGLQIAASVGEQDEQAVDRTRELLVPIASVFADLTDFRTIDGISCDRFFSGLEGDDPIYASVGVATADGNVVCSSVPHSAPVNLADRPYFQDALRSNGPTVGRLIVDRLSGKRTFNVATPIVRPDGSVSGVAFAAIDLAQLQPTAEMTGLPTGSYAEVTDSSGTILARVPDPRRLVGTSLEGTALFRSISAQTHGTADVRGPDNVPALVAFTRLDALGGDAFAVVSIPRTSAFSAANGALRSDLALLGGVIAIALAVGWYVSDRTVVQPVQRLIDATRRVSAGDLGARVGPRYAGGEIGTVGHAFDAMAESLEGRTAELHELNATLERRVAERTQALSDANHELEAFTYSVSHDLRTPLRSVVGFSELLEEEFGERLDPEARRYVGMIHGGAEQMGALIDDLLQFSRVSRAGLERRPTPLEPVVQAALQEVEPDMQGRAVDLTVGDLGVADVDGAMLQRVYVNLLSNAVKFTRARDIAHIEVGCEPLDGTLAYYVRDNGVGFDASAADRLFGVFQRFHLADEYEGTGVGLAIVERIVSRHGGRVWAEGAPGQGATFYFTIGGAGGST